MAPEVLLQKPYGKEVDLWSLGVISYLLLSRVLPFDDEDDREIARQTIYEPPDFSFHPWEKVSDGGKDLCKSKWLMSIQIHIFALWYNQCTEYHRASWEEPPQETSAGWGSQPQMVLRGRICRDSQVEIGSRRRRSQIHGLHTDGAQLSQAQGGNAEVRVVITQRNRCKSKMTNEGSCH